jgi:hypothetical protein
MVRKGMALLGLFLITLALGGLTACASRERAAQTLTPTPVQGLEEDAQHNRVSAFGATVAGGSHNAASAARTTVSGGSYNSATVEFATVGGGNRNTASGTRATVGGGYGNVASHIDATVSGGGGNAAAGKHATVGGGSHNSADGFDAAVGGGSYNTASNTNTAVAGGTRNTATGFGAFVGGGAGNTASAAHAAVNGGINNLASGLYASVAGGQSNSAGGAFSSVPGGSYNAAEGDFSLAAGRNANIDPAHGGTFLYADASEFPFASAAPNEFAVRATGGVRLVSGIDAAGNPNAGVVLEPGSGSWATLSDRDAKTAFAPVDGQQILAQLAQLPISTWRYGGQDPAIRHIGPTAQDFKATFGLGGSDKAITTVDADGVSLAATQALYELLQQQEKEIAALEARLAALEAKLEQPACGDQAP